MNEKVTITITREQAVIIKLALASHIQEYERLNLGGSMLKETYEDFVEQLNKNKRG